MKKLFLAVLLVLVVGASAKATLYVIDSSGISFYDTEVEKWEAPSSFRMHEIKIKPFPIVDPRGGKGIVKKAYVDPLVPYAYYVVQTYDFSPKKWSYFIKIERNLVHIYFPRLYRRERDE